MSLSNVLKTNKNREAMIEAIEESFDQLTVDLGEYIPEIEDSKWAVELACLEAVVAGSEATNVNQLAAEAGKFARNRLLYLGMSEVVAGNFVQAVKGAIFDNRVGFSPVLDFEHEICSRYYNNWNRLSDYGDSIANAAEKARGKKSRSKIRVAK